ncbi:tight adherence pilus pseudopilin TadF [Salmonella enterica]
MDKQYIFVSTILNSRSRASVTIEFAIIFPILVLLALILLDFTSLYANESRLARTGSSLASVLRERTLLYGKNETVTQSQVDELYLVANELLAKSQLFDKVSINVQAVYFSDSSTKNKKVIDSKKTINIIKSSTVNPVSCNPVNDIESNAIIALSVWSGDLGGTKRWLPVYQITLCVKGDESYFLKALSYTGAVAPSVISSNAVVSR